MSPVRFTHLLTLALLGLLLALSAGCPSSNDDDGGTTAGPSGGAPAPPTITDDELVRRNNEAVGLMGQYAYRDALAIFSELRESRPDHVDLKVNTAIATLNRQQLGDEDTAIAMLEEVLADEPNHLRAQYCLGLLLLYRGPPADPTPYFEAVAKAAPEDADAAYQWAKCLESAGRPEEARQWYERALAADPYLNSCHLGLSRVHRALGDPDAAMASTNAFQAMRENPRARTFDFVYMEMGELGEAMAFGTSEPNDAARPIGPVFGEAMELALDGADAAAFMGATSDDLTVADVDGDGRLDVLVVVDAGREVAGRTMLLLGGGTDDAPSFSAAVDHPTSGIESVRTALWGDLDNDGLTDVVLCRRGPNIVLRGTTDGGYENVTEAWGVGGGDLDTVAGAIVDADHDGDLDIVLVHADGPLALLNNDRDGSFTDIAPDRGIGGASQGARRLIVGDFDGRGDADLLVLGASTPHRLHLNRRLWEYTASDAPFLRSTIAAAAAGDVDTDGRLDLVTIDSSGACSVWSRATNADGTDQWAPTALSGVAIGAGVTDAALRDLDGDGHLDLLAVGSARVQWIAGPLASGAPGESTLLDTTAAGWTTLVRDASKGTELLVLHGAADAKLLHLHPAGPGRFGFSALTFSGKEKLADKMRSNASGIGTTFAARLGERWVTGTSLPSDGTAGQSLQPIPIGLGGADRIDVLEMTWSDGVFQSELALEADALHAIEETQRQVSSCPVLFAWNGERFEFVSDVLGVGGIGYLISPGTYSTPRPDESFLMPEGIAQPRDGAYVLRLGEPMEEVCYLDHLGLETWDLPPGWSMTLDERLATAAPEATGEPRFFRTELLPARVTNARGVDVTDDVARVDARAADPGPLDHRFIGRTEREHVLTLTFETPLDAPAGAPMLLADGWVEYPYSQTNFAAWQAGATYDPPTIEALGADGAWVTILDRFGYPAGMPRQMSAPLGELPAGTTALRIRSNLEIYWDRLSVAYAEACPAATKRVLTLEHAALERPGFPARSDNDQRRPDYDFQNRTPRWDMRTLPGHYTAYGDVTALIRGADESLAVFGSGEDVVARFGDDGPPVSAGWTRRLVVVSRGWCKDMDLFTRGGESVEPLPNADVASEQAARATEAARTRFAAGP